MPDNDSYSQLQHYQGLTVAISGPCHGPVRVPVSVHEQTGIEYIRMSSIRDMYPDMIGLEIDGVRIFPNVGFDFLEVDPNIIRSGKEAEDFLGGKSIPGFTNDLIGIFPDMEMPKPSMKHGLSIGGDYDLLFPIERSLISQIEKQYCNLSDGLFGVQVDPLQQGGTNDILGSEITGINNTTLLNGNVNSLKEPHSNESFEWIHYFPGKTICVLYDCSFLRDIDTPSRKRPKGECTESHILVPSKSNDPSSHTDLQWSQFRNEMKELILEECRTLKSEVIDLHTNIISELKRQIPSQSTGECGDNDPPTNNGNGQAINYSRGDGISNTRASSQFGGSGRYSTQPVNTFSSTNNSPRTGSSCINRDYHRDRSGRYDHRNHSTRYFDPTRQSDRGDRRPRIYNGTNNYNPTNNGWESIVPRYTRTRSSFENELFRFVKDCEGTVTENSLDITITLKSTREAKSLYRLITSESHRGHSLDITFEWNWLREDIQDIVTAIKASTIGSLRLCCTQGTKYNSIFDAPSSSQHAPLIYLLGHRSLSKLWFIKMPELLSVSEFRIPPSLSHLNSVRLQLDPTARKENLVDIIRKATNLKELIIDSSPDFYQDQLEIIGKTIMEYNRSDDHSERSQASSISDSRSQQGGIASSRTGVHFYFLEKNIFFVSFDRQSSRIKEFLLNLYGVNADQTFWRSIFLSSVLDPITSITTLKIMNMKDNSWVSFLLNLIEANPNQIKIQELRIDCGYLKHSNLEEVCRLVYSLRSTLHILNIKSLCFPVVRDDELIEKGGSDEEGDAFSDTLQADSINWGHLFQSLNYIVLERLEVEAATLGDTDTEALLRSIEKCSPWDRLFGFSKLVLVNTKITARGKSDLVAAGVRNHWSVVQI
ncbi:hypothetical protein BGZ76_002711 [Entomortierella beljakovae]|nr:hypothetical protein BGZ76_002711 [Entomortierella beljakovae]